jgi:hypothetical protein
LSKEEMAALRERLVVKASENAALHQEKAVALWNLEEARADVAGLRAALEKKEEELVRALKNLEEERAKSQKLEMERDELLREEEEEDEEESDGETAAAAAAAGDKDT